MKKIVTSLLVFVFSFMFINNVNAITITESTDPADGLTTIQDNSIVIGVTRFEDGVVITAQRAATAGVNDALFNIGVDGYSGVNIYYYLGGSWFVLDDENKANPLDESNPEDQETIEELESPEIYYVNNVEKQLTVDFTFDGEGRLEFNTDNNKDGLVSFADGKLTIPATVKSLQIEIKDPDTEGVIGLVVLTKDPDNKTDYKTTSLTNYINALGRVVEADYTEASWTTYQSVVLANEVTKNNTQEEVDTATTNITTAQGSLVTKLAEAKEAALDIKSEAELRASLAYEGVTELKLNQDINLVNRLDITGGKVITLDLNGKTLSRDNQTIRVQNGTLNVIGTGTIKENLNNGYAPILIKGSSLSTNTNYSNVNIGENVTLKGWAGIFIDQNLTKAYGVNVEFNGKIVSPAEVEHTTAGFGIYVNGSIKHAENAPVIRIGSTAIIESPRSHGIYAAGYANWTIEDGASITGVSAIEIKAGTMAINGGTFTATEVTPSHVAFGNGTSTKGYALAVVNNVGYGNTASNPLTVTINKGTFSGPIAILDDDEITTNNYAVLTNNGGTFSDLLNAVKYSGSSSTIKLATDINLVKRLDITGGKVITLDLNGKTLSSDSLTILVNGGTLNVIGTGTIKENLNNGYAPILIKGSSLSTNTNYSNVNIGENVTLKGWAGIFIDQNLTKAYGVNVEFNGKIVSPAEVEHTTAGFGIYVNGSIKHAENAPVIRIGSTAIIESPRSHGIYAAGYANWTIEDGASITGVSAIEIKAGTMTINGGTFTATEETPSHVAFGNGTSTKGYALAVVNNPGYGNTSENPLTVTIYGGTYNGNRGTLDDDDDDTNNYAVLDRK